MQFNISLPPQGVIEAAQAGLQQLVRRPGETTKGVLGGGGASDLVAPHPVYLLGLEQAAGASSLAAARHTGWRLLLTGGEAHAAVEVNAGASPADRGAATPEKSASASGPREADRFSFARLISGPAVDETFAELHRLGTKTPDTSPKQTFEIRLLRIPALHVQCLWLHYTAADRASNSSGTTLEGSEAAFASDTFLPLPPAHKPFAVGVPLSASELEQLLRQMARTRLEQADSGDATGG